MGNPIWFIFWLIVFLIISLWLAGICCFFYIIFSILEVCCSGLSELTSLSLRGIQFPAYCAKAMMDCKSPF